MELLRSLNIDPNVPKSELVSTLSTQSVDSLLSLRSALFEDARSAALTHPNDALVSRRSTGKTPLIAKLSEDVWTLLHSLKNSYTVPHSVLRNGKRSETYLNLARTQSQNLSQGPALECQHRNFSQIPRQNQSQCTTSNAAHSLAFSGVRRELNSVKEQVKSLISEVSFLRSKTIPAKTISSCHVHVSCKQPASAADLPKIIGCPVLDVTQVGPSGLSWKVKLSRHHLYDAMTSTCNTHSVSVWRNNNSHSLSASYTRTVSPSRTSIQNNLIITTWNCRGLHNSHNYLLELISKGSDVIVLQEHWLWPYELSNLAALHADFSYTAVSDNRLNSQCDLQQGCGGVAILWNKRINAVPISAINSDRIRGIRIPLSDSDRRVLTVLGAYMPSSNSPHDLYTTYFNFIEEQISQLGPDGPLFVVGDLNAHLATTDNCQSCNPRGTMWRSLIDSQNLYDATQGCLTSGPSFTYSSGGHSTFLDYILANQDGARGVSFCNIHEEHPLNTSDHLPVSCHLEISHLRTTPTLAFPNLNLNWSKAVQTNEVLLYSTATDEVVRSLLDKDYSAVEDLDSDINLIARKLLEAGEATIPKVGKNKNSDRKFKDCTLSHLCWKSRVAFRKWKDDGRPVSGPSFNERKKCKNEVKKYLNKCHARRERLRILKRDEMFQQNHPHRFRSAPHAKSVCSKLLHNGSIVSNKQDLLDCFADHFNSLGQSKCDSNQVLTQIKMRMSDLSLTSLTEPDNIITDDFSVEEIEYAIRRLKRNRAGGPDNVSPEHIKYSGPIFKNWLCQICNHICRLERIPQTFKQGIIIPIHKGKGKDPLITKSYRGITLTSVFAKVLEITLLERIKPVLEEHSVPQPTQTAYRSGASCRDSIFASLETERVFRSEGDVVYSSFFDLTCAFDTVEFCVLLDQVFNVGVRGKCWRLLNDWYCNTTSRVRLGNLQSTPFNIGRGIRQGSVLSPTLFNLVVDPLLSTLKSQSLGLSINGLFLGAFAHADDIRTLASSPHDSALQTTAVRSFADCKGLQISTEKCALIMSGGKSSSLSPSLRSGLLPLNQSTKCLGVWWNSAPSSRQSVDERLNKARCAFFVNGQLGAFHGLLNPVSSRSIVESCVFPVLMYGSESWILNSTLLSKLESFQAEIGKRILSLSRYTSNYVPILALKWPSVTARLLCSKLSFLHAILNDDSDESLSSQVFHILAASDIDSISLIKQCRLLDQTLGLNFTETLLVDPSTSFRDLKRQIITADYTRTLNMSEQHVSLEYVLKVANGGSWMRFWDNALEYGPEGTKASLAILNILSKSVFSDRACPIDNCSFVVPRDTPLCDHLLSTHLNLTNCASPKDLADSVISSLSDPESFEVVLSTGRELLC